MKFHSNALSDLLAALHKQNEVLGRARDLYLSKEAEKKHFEATLVLKAHGASMVERKTHAEASVEWLVFHNALARLESIYRFQELKMQILDKEFQAQYLTHKLDGSLIKKEQ